MLALTGPAREHNERAWTPVTEDEREVIWCVFMVQQRGLAADRTVGIEGWAGVEASLVPAETI